MWEISQICGFTGTLIAAIAYLPQINHLAKEHCSAGMSSKAWLLWLLGSVLIFYHAISIVDNVFIALQAVNIIAIVLILVLCRRYQGMTCPLHGGHGHSFLKPSITIEKR